MHIQPTEMLSVSDIETRNEVRLENGNIDCEFNHPKYGWIPFTADPNDCEEHGRIIWAALDAMLPPYVPEPEESPPLD
jgi:hypothetical protein